MVSSTSFSPVDAADKHLRISHSLPELGRTNINDNGALPIDENDDDDATVERMNTSAPAVMETATITSVPARVGSEPVTSRRESMEFEQLLPRKRVAIDVSGDVDQQYIDQATEDDAVVEVDAAVDVIPILDSDEDNASLEDHVIIQEASLEDFSSDDDRDQNGAISSDDVSRSVLLKAMESKGNASSISIGLLLSQANTAIANDDPEEWLLALNGFLSEFVKLPDDLKAGFYVTGSAIFEYLPRLALQFLLRNKPVPSRFWRTRGVEIATEFVELFIQVTIYNIQADHKALKSSKQHGDFATGLALSPSYVTALTRAIIVAEQNQAICGSSAAELVAWFSSVMEKIVFDRGVRDIMQLWVVATQESDTLNAENISTLLQYVSFVSNLCWMSQRVLKAGEEEVFKSPSSVSSLSSSTSLPALSNLDDDKRKQNYTRRNSSLHDFESFFEVQETTLRELIDANSSTNRATVVSWIEKTTLYFYVLVQENDCGLISKHAATTSPLKNPDIPKADIQRYCHIIRKIYWFMYLFKSSRAEFKLFGMKKISLELNQLYQEAQNTYAGIVIKCIAVVASSLEFTQYLVSNEANNIYIAQFGATIYALFSIYHVIQISEIKILWETMVSDSTSVLFSSICGIFVSIGQWLDQDLLEWLLEQYNTLPLRMLDGAMLKLFEILVQTYVSQVTTESGSSTTISTATSKSEAMKTTTTSTATIIEPIKVILNIIKLVSNAAEQEISTLKVSQSLILNSLGKCLDLILSLTLNNTDDNEIVHLFATSCTRIAILGHNSISDLYFIKSFLSHRPVHNDPNRDNINTLTEGLVKNIRQWRNNSGLSTSLQRTGMALRLDVLFQLLRHEPNALADRNDMHLLWECFTGDWLKEDFCDSFWEYLNAFLEGTPFATSTFVDFSFDALQQADPDIFTPSCVGFIVKYLDRQLTPVPSHEPGQNIVVIPGFNILWRVYTKTSHEDSKNELLNLLISLFTRSEFLKFHGGKSLEQGQRELIQFIVSTIKKSGQPVDGDDSWQTFTRSCTFLDLFLDSYHHVDASSILSTGHETETSVTIKGSPITIKLQWNLNKIASPVTSLITGDENTIQELFAQIRAIVKVNDFRVIVMGDEIYEKSMGLQLKDAGFLPTTAVLVVLRRQSLADNIAEPSIDLQAKQSGHNQLPMPTEQEFTSKIDALYELLDLPDKHAAMIWSIMRRLNPPSEQIQQFMTPIIVEQKFDVLFPLQKPYKLLYATYVLQNVHEQYKKGLINSEWIHGSCKHVLPHLLNLIVSSDLVSQSTSEVLALVRNSLVVRAIQFLNDDAFKNMTDSYYSDQHELEHLVSRFAEIADLGPKELSDQVLNLLLIITLRDFRAWQAVADCLLWRTLFEHSLLKSDSGAIRTSAGNAITGFVKTLVKQVDSPVTEAALSYFWQVIENLLPSSNIEIAKQSSQLFKLADVVLQAILEHTSIQLDETTLVLTWLVRLDRQSHTESLFSFECDNIVLGYALLAKRLLSHSLRLVGMSVMFFSKVARFLFPNNDKAKSNNSLVIEKIGCVNSETRSALYDLLLALADSKEKVAWLVRDTVHVFPRDQLLHDSWNADRSAWLKSGTGFAGLQNLANTCYVNSFTNQLYMNKEFRKCIYNLYQDPEAGELSTAGSHKSSNVNQGSELINNLVILFSYLQYSWQQVLDPQNFIQAIIDYESKPIDVTVQMDVDEFYSLLFDRIEGQILDKNKKAAIRSCYGGMQMTQVKSKECDHISERAEPFSAIQCDIKGKTNLQESLNAYVEGETLDGDNKYWCSSCSLHVEAERRSCLKDVPNHLIFHLKRFDFDLQTMQRSKINDFFEFPMQLDISPYTFEYLQNKQDSILKSSSVVDEFKLVGILVHSGTAESGHYYSYIRKSDDDTWFEFNDADVNKFDPGDIPNTCFGGSIDGDVHEYMEKPFSAYMLFYDRIKPEHELQPDDNLNCPLSLRARICKENENFARKYCAFGSEHLQYVKNLYDRMTVQKDESWVFSVSKAYLTHHFLMFESFFQIVSRIKDSKDVEPYLKSIESSFSDVSNCLGFLSWIAEVDFLMKNLLLRCPNNQVRHGTADLIIRALAQVKSQRPDLYGSLQDWLYVVTDENQQNIVLKVIMRLRELLAHSGSYTQSWDEFFGLLNAFARVGQDECGILLYVGVLQRALNSFYDDHHHHHARNTVLVIDRRRPSYSGLLDLVLMLLKRADLQLELEETPLSRYKVDDLDEEFDINSIPLTIQEYESITRVRKNTIVLLYKLISLDCPLEQVVEFVHIIRKIDFGSQSDLVMFLILNTILTGLNLENEESVLPFLLCFGKVCPDFELNEHDWDNVTNELFKCLEDMADYMGKHYVDFLAVEFESPETPELLRRSLITKCGLWAPPLLLHWSATVRDSAARLCQRYLLGKLQKVIVRPVDADLIVDVDDGGFNDGDGSGEKEAILERYRLERLRLYTSRVKGFVQASLQYINANFINSKSWSTCNNEGPDFDIMIMILRASAQLLDDESLMARIESLRQELNTTQIPADDGNSVEWSSDANGEIGSDNDGGYLMEFDNIDN
ncbi:hypothetical protein V1514DRAFT_321824 [Lipomyces japonicus]|uniref:uncharacterized protein n=1 Tax=Lipomyces japonicus TaxID=56871 RepID=UPI0034CD1876